jgi:hypothetical protein
MWLRHYINSPFFVYPFFSHGFLTLVYYVNNDEKREKNVVLDVALKRKTNGPITNPFLTTLLEVTPEIFAFTVTSVKPKPTTDTFTNA